MNEHQISQVVEQVLQQTEGRKMSLKLACRLIERIEKKAESMGVAVIIAVADRAARPVAVHCMDEAYIASYDIALNKAYTSAGLKMSTSLLAELASPGGELYGIQHTNQGQIVVFGGGEPLQYEGRLIGALGVSGGSLSQDTELAAYGKEIFGEVLECL